MKKNLVAKLLLVCMCLGLLTSCANKGEETIGTDLLNETGLPIAKEPVELEVVVYKAPQYVSYSEMPILKELEEKTNVKIKWREYPAEKYGEKVNLMLSSQEYPDIMWRHLSDPQLLELSSNDIVYQLDDLIAKYAPRWSEIFEQKPYVKSVATAPDGHIYSLPYVRYEEAYVGFRDAMFINKDWLDKLQLEVPKTTEELRHVLKEFKEKDPNGNGIADELPWSFLYGNNISGEMDIYGSFGLIETAEHMVVENGKVIYAPMDERNKEAVKFLHQLYLDGTIDPESFVQNNAQYTAKVKTSPSIVGMFSAFGNLGATSGSNYVPIEPFKSENVDQPKMRRQTNMVEKSFFTVFKKNKYPEISMRWANELVEKDMSLQALYGPLEKQEDGTYRTMNEILVEGELVKFPGNVGPFATFDEDLAKIKDNETKNSRDELYEIYKPYTVDVKDMIPPVWYTPEEREVLNRYRTEINEYTKTVRSGWITKGGIDEEWDGFIAKLESLGVQKVIDVYQQAYDRFYAENK